MSDDYVPEVEPVPGCNCPICRSIRNLKKIETQMVGDFNTQRGYEIFSKFGQQNLSPVDEISRLCMCWFRDALGMSDELKLEIYEILSKVAVVETQENQAIPSEELQPVEIDALVADFRAILGKFRKT